MTSKPANPYPSFHPARWIPAIWNLGHRRLQPQMKVFILSSLVGLVAGLGAVLFYLACQVVTHYALAKVTGYEQSAPGGEAAIFSGPIRPLVPWLLLIVPTIGGLISGFIVYTFAPEAEGHGTDSAIDAYHNKGGVIRPRVPFIKIITSAITLGTGGSGGREGPIAQIGAGFGSFFAGTLKLQARERRTLMAAGMGAGIAAIFRAPLAGALFAAEVLYRSADFESEVVIPAGLASVIAYCTFALFFGWSSLFATSSEFVNALTFNDPRQLIGYTILVPFMVVLAMLYTHSFYGLTAAFHRMKFPRTLRPMIGACCTGIIGVGLYYAFKQDVRILSVLSFGYGILQNALTVDPHMESDLWFAAILMAVAIGKIFTTGLTIGSGGSGGVFGPSMVIGGCGGGALGILLHRFAPAIAPHPASFVIVGMAGFFSAAAKTPFSTLVIVSEMTGSYSMLMPTLWVCTLTFLLADEVSIYHSQLDSPIHSPAHQGDFVRTVLAGLSVRQFLTGADPPTLSANHSLNQVIERLASSTYSAIPVVDPMGRLLGMVNLNNVHLASRSPEIFPLITAFDLMNPRIIPLHPDDRLDRAVELFVENGLDALPVVEEKTRRVIGIVRRDDVAKVYLKQVQGVNPLSP